VCFGNAAKGGSALIGIQVEKETRELLAWYVNGTLGGADRDRVEAALQNATGASSLLVWERAVQAAAKNDPAFDISADRGLYQTMQRIRAEAASKAAPTRAARGGWFSRLGEKLQWSPALAVACGLVAVQFAVIAQMWSARSEGSEYAGVRAMDRRVQTASTFIRIAFKPDITEGDLNSLLRGIQAEIVSGPSQLGDYYLLLKKQGAEGALSVLQNSASVESVEIVNALPARP
jgi:hypothetical protein